MLSISVDNDHDGQFARRLSLRGRQFKAWKPGGEHGGGALIGVRLTAIRYAARDTHLFEFRSADGAPLPPADAGAHVDLHLPNGMVRQYSLTHPDAAPKTYTLGIKRDPESRGGSRYIFDELKVGQLLEISVPRNNFPLLENAEHTVLIAGGIGITPIWSMAQRLRALKRSWQLCFSTRSRQDMAFLDILQAIPVARLHFDDEAAGGFMDIGSIVGEPQAGTHLYCCGPNSMLSAFEAATKAWPAEQVHVEYFTSKEAPALDGEFVVELARSKQQFSIPRGRSILDVLRDAGLDVTSSCEQGVCGACETAVISGAPDHRDSVLSDSERAANRSMMICCSGARSDRLVLDL
jgi:ferredoxin-NADP reductase